MTSKAAAPAKSRRRTYDNYFDGWTVEIHGTWPPVLSPQKRVRFQALILVACFETAKAHPEVFGEHVPATPSVWECEQIVRRRLTAGQGHADQDEEEPATLVAAGA